MLFASFGHDVLSIAFMFGLGLFFFNRWLKKNPEVGEHANKAAKNTALSLISRLFRK
jgi:hypothetical protein